MGSWQWSGLTLLGAIAVLTVACFVLALAVRRAVSIERRAADLAAGEAWFRLLRHEVGRRRSGRR